jgi:hypothetical protein
MWESHLAISKSGGKGGKPAFGFPGFPPLVISTAYFLLSSTSLLSSACRRYVGIGRILHPFPGCGHGP